MKKTIIGIFERFFGSYGDISAQFSQNRSILLKILLIPILVFIYTLTLVVISTVVLIVLLVVLPISAIYKTNTQSLLGKQG